MVASETLIGTALWSDSAVSFLFSGESKPSEQATRSLRGVMRVGLVAKGLLLKGDLDLELVLLCKDKPTISLLKKVAENLSVQLKVWPPSVSRILPPGWDGS